MLSSLERCINKGALLSPHLFSIYTEDIMSEVMIKKQSTPFDGIKLNGIEFTELRKAADTVLLSTAWTGLQNNITFFMESSDSKGLFLNAKKTKHMTADKGTILPNVSIIGEVLETVQSYKHVRTFITTNEDTSKERRSLCTNYSITIFDAIDIPWHYIRNRPHQHGDTHGHRLHCVF